MSTEGKFEEPEEVQYLFTKHD